MAWLRNHIRHFVVPALRVLGEKFKALPYYERQSYASRTKYQREYESTRMDAGRLSVRSTDVIGPPQVGLQPHPAEHKEAGLVLAAIYAFGLHDCISEETYATLSTGQVTTALIGSYGHRDVEMQDLHTIIKNSWRALHRLLQQDPKRRLILPGRDVWAWEVMARCKNVPTLFIPEVSRFLVKHENAFKTLVQSWKLDKDCIVFDTGFAGSIYDAICRAAGLKCVNLMLSTTRTHSRKKPRLDLAVLWDGKTDSSGMLSKSAHLTQERSEQIFPNHKHARSKALAIEYLPKYFKTGTSHDDKVPVQYLSNVDEFVRAAALTIWLVKFESPRWTDQGQPKCRTVNCPGCRSCLLWKAQKTKEVNVVP